MLANLTQLRLFIIVVLTAALIGGATALYGAVVLILLSSAIATVYLAYIIWQLCGIFTVDNKVTRGDYI